MQKNKSILTLLAGLFISLSLNGQNALKQHFRVDFGRCDIQEYPCSEAFAIADSVDYEFMGASAYTAVDNAPALLQIRYYRDGRWLEWQDFSQTHGQASKGRIAYKADPVFEKVEKVQFRSSEALDKIVHFRLYLALPQKKSPALTAAPRADSCSCPPPPICQRSCWCPNGQCPQNYTPTPTQPTHLIVHHSAGFNSAPDYKNVVEYYWDLHVHTNGWDDIGYNWLIDPDGVIYEGRGKQVQGAHFSCMNSQTSGICLIGNFENANPTVAAKESLQKLLAWLGCENQITPLGRSVHSSSNLNLHHISGHKDGNNATTGCPKGTACPGKNLYAQLPQIRQKVGADSCLGPLSTEEVLAHEEVEVYPNPVKDKIHVSWNTSASKIKSIKLFTLEGKEVSSSKIQMNRNTAILNLGDLSTGIYFLKISTSKRNEIKKIRKE